TRSVLPAAGWHARSLERIAGTRTNAGDCRAIGRERLRRAAGAARAGDLRRAGCALSGGGGLSQPGGDGAARVRPGRVQVLRLSVAAGSGAIARRTLSPAGRGGQP